MIRYFLLHMIIIGLGMQSFSRAAEVDVPRFALLVGVEKYAHLSSGEQLDGCSNDVVVMRQLLEERFGFEANQIETLTNEEATGTAIREALKRLSDRVRVLPDELPAAQVIFHFSGHGSQVPDQPSGPNHDEPDGLDETLVPHDASKQGSEEDLRDDELFQYVEEICHENRAHMWLVLDCCHSGSGARGTTKLRKLIREQEPVQSIGGNLTKRKLPSGAVMLAACRAREVEPEYRDGDQSYGLMTRFLVQVLNQENNISKLSYGLLRESIVSCYRRDPSVSQAPVPQLEGESSLITGGILGKTGVDRPQYWEVQKNGTDRSKMLLKAGAFHGVTAGSIYEVYDAAVEIELTGELSGHNGNSLGWLLVDSTSGATGTASYFQWNGDKQIIDKFPSKFTRGYAVERFHHHGSFELRLRIEQVTSESGDVSVLPPGSELVPPAIAAAINSTTRSTESPWLLRTDGEESCDVVLKIDGNYAALFPSTGFAYVAEDATTTRGDIPPSLKGGWGPFHIQTAKCQVEDDSDPMSLEQFLRSINRARNLLRISNTQVALAGNARGQSGSAIDVSLDLVAIDEFQDDGFTPHRWHRWEPEEDALIMEQGALYAFEVTNRESSGVPVYISVLSIDSNMGIDQILPFQDGVELIGEQTLTPGESRLTDCFECDAANFPGQRWAVVLATRTQNDFYMLSQPSLQTTRSLKTEESQSLGHLLMQQTYFQNTTRGDRRRRPVKLYDETWSAATLEWLAVPEK
ncbi:Caspase domain protein [Polystyrenella longa]|uniref:Caspase domain protein n=1 Tax=Polystyrenella longa TaxID=2528007 RepID=A0A518CLM5_9PLAN|nr:caspase family protein [Polystyrenella longa]QDU80131.1 Caspase domain protein [Polystyrenella longa]